MEIYFARSMVDYDSYNEKRCIENIKNNFNDCEVIDFPIIDEMYKDEHYRFGEGLIELEKDIFFPLIKKSDLVIAFPKMTTDKRGYYSKGVLIEIEYALNIRKRVKGVINGELNDIKFSDLLKIKNVNVLEKKDNVEGSNIKKNDDQYYKNHKKMLETHNLMMGFYQRNENVMSFMKRFLSIDKGCVPIAIQKRFPGSPPIRYMPRNSNRFIFLDEMSVVDLQKSVGQLHFYEFIYDENVKDNDLISDELERAYFVKANVFDKHIIGAKLTFDIDSPKDKNGDKKDMFSVYEEFMNIKIKSEDYLKDQGMNTKAVFTGNGIDIVGENYYFNENDDNLDDFIEQRYEIIYDLNRNQKNDNQPRIDDKNTSWSNYNKMPFTYYNKMERLTIPIASGYIEKELLEKMTDFNYVIGNEKESIIVNDIIKKSRW